MNNDLVEEETTIQSNYFDRRVDEEDEPVIVEDENQIKGEVLDNMFEDFFDEDFLYVAKVTYLL